MGRGLDDEFWNNFTSSLVFVGVVVVGKRWVIWFRTIESVLTDFIEQSFGESIRPRNSASTRPGFCVDAVEWGEVDVLELLQRRPQISPKSRFKTERMGFKWSGFIKSCLLERSESIEAWRSFRVATPPYFEGHG